MWERGEAEGKAYMEKLLAKWKAYRKGIATMREAIHDKINAKEEVTRRLSEVKRRP
jgi:hypothetical protein